MLLVPIFTLSLIPMGVVGRIVRAAVLDGGLPAQYKPQVHWCLVVTGREWWDFCSYSGGLPPVLVRVTPDDYTDKVRECMEKFWTRYQELLAKVMAQRERAIDDAIAELLRRRGHAV